MGHNGPVEAIVHDGDHYVASAGGDTVCLWSLGDESELHIIFAVF